jgi:hypothetical protein
VLGQLQRVLTDPAFHQVGVPGLQRLKDVRVVNLGIGRAFVVADGPPCLAVSQ